MFSSSPSFPVKAIKEQKCAPWFAGYKANFPVHIKEPFSRFYLKQQMSRWFIKNPVLSRLRGVFQLLVHKGRTPQYFLKNVTKEILTLLTIFLTEFFEDFVCFAIQHRSFILGIVLCHLQDFIFLFEPDIISASITPFYLLPCS